MNKDRRVATTKLPFIEWIPGVLAIEYVKGQLECSSKSASQLLSTALNDGKIKFRHKHVFDYEDFERSEAMGMPVWLKAEDLLLKREDVLAWSKMLTMSRAANSNNNPDRPLQTRERETLLKMIYGMARGKYNYNSSKARNQATQQIADDCARAGVSVDPDTVRSWLRKASQELPDAYSSGEDG